MQLHVMLHEICGLTHTRLMRNLIMHVRTAISIHCIHRCYNNTVQLVCMTYSMAQNFNNNKILWFAYSIIFIIQLKSRWILIIQKHSIINIQGQQNRVQGGGGKGALPPVFQICELGGLAMQPLCQLSMQYHSYRYLNTKADSYM